LNDKDDELTICIESPTAWLQGFKPTKNLKNYERAKEKNGGVNHSPLRGATCSSLLFNSPSGF